MDCRGAVVLAVAAALLLAGVQMPAPTAGRDRTATRGAARLIVDTSTGHALLAACGVNVVGSAVAIALVPLAERGWHDGDFAFGLATAALGFGGLAAPLLSRLGKRPSVKATWSIACVSLPLLWVAVSPGVLWAAAPLALAGAAAVQVEAFATATIQDEMPDHARGSALGIADSAIVTAALVGSLAGPLLVTGVGARGAVAVLGLLTVLLVIDVRRATQTRIEKPAAYGPSTTGTGSVRSA